MRNINIIDNIKNVGRILAEKPAICTSEGEVLSYNDLLLQTEGISDYFNSLGISRTDRIAMALSDGLDTALLFL